MQSNSVAEEAVEYRVWGGVWICTPEENGCIWPEGVIACWDDVGICAIEIIGEKGAMDYGIDGSDVPAIIVNDGRNTVLPRSYISHSSVTNDGKVILLHLEEL